MFYEYIIILIDLWLDHELQEECVLMLLPTHRAIIIMHLNNKIYKCTFK